MAWPPWASLENSDCHNTQVRVYAVKRAYGSDKTLPTGSLVGKGERGLLVVVLWSQKTSCLGPYGHVSHPWVTREDRLYSGETTRVQVGRLQLTHWGQLQSRGRRERWSDFMTSWALGPSSTFAKGRCCWLTLHEGLRGKSVKTKEKTKSKQTGAVPWH